MKLVKQTIALTAVAALTLGAMTGCGSSTATENTATSATTESAAQTENTAASGEKIELTVWHTWGAGPGLDAMQSIVDKYNETNDKNIQVNLGFVANQASGNTQTMDKLMAAIAAGNPPEIALLDNFQVAGWAAQDALVPLDDLMGSVGLSLDGIYEWALEGSQYKGATYSIPYNGDARVLFYNKDLFEAAGLDPENPPTTWEEWQQASAAITQSGDDV